ncbi:MAG: PIN domain-containing protein [Oscillospiraceae bacterium]|nr:PIN domain-containing protein [Oscillospiraceae bacterium]
MILLADSNVFIKLWRGTNEERANIKSIMSKNEVLVCGVVRAELFQGAQSEKTQRDVASTLSMYGTKNLGDNDWDELGHQLRRYKACGFTVPFTDAVIASIAIKYDIPVWANDKHFEMMKRVIPGLAVYRTEELILDSDSFE